PTRTLLLAGTPFGSPRLLPKVTCWLAKVPDQSIPLTVLGLRVVSISWASINTCRVGESSLVTKFTTPSISFSVVVTSNWLVRGSAITLLLFERVDLISKTRFVGSLYLSWIVREKS